MPRILRSVELGRSAFLSSGSSFLPILSELIYIITSPDICCFQETSCSHYAILNWVATEVKKLTGWNFDPKQ